MACLCIFYPVLEQSLTHQTIGSSFWLVCAFTFQFWNNVLKTRLMCPVFEWQNGALPFKKWSRSSGFQMVGTKWQIPYCTILSFQHLRDCNFKTVESRICEFCSEVLGSEDAFIEHANKSHHNQIKDIWIQCDHCRTLLPDNEVIILKIICRLCHRISSLGINSWASTGSSTGAFARHLGFRFSGFGGT